MQGFIDYFGHIWILFQGQLHTRGQRILSGAVRQSDLH